MTLALRKYRREDLDFVLEATVSTYRENVPAERLRGQDRAKAEAAFREAFRDLLRRGSSELFIAEEDGLRVGYVFVGESQDLFTTTNHLLIYDLYVVPERRNRGIGRYLLAKAEQYAALRHFDRISLHVFVTNPAALHLYGSMGYRAEAHIMYKYLEKLPTSP